MIKLLTHPPTPNLLAVFWRRSYPISVYEGISPALLATMSLSQGVRGSNNQELINSLVKSNIIRNATLQRVLKRLDRKEFISDQLNKKGNCYENKPYKISGGQNMTDIFTHAVILEQLSTHIQEVLQKQRNQLKQQYTILDIGTGHGFLAFSISAFVQEVFKAQQLSISHRVVAIDSNLPAIDFCNNLKERYRLQNLPGVEKVEFYSQPLERVIQQNNKGYDLVVGGFYMPPLFNQGLMQVLKHSSKSKGTTSLGIWPSDSSTGQSLYTFVAPGHGANILKNQIMSTMFSMPTVKTTVSKYFIEDSSHQEIEQAPQLKQGAQVMNQEELRQKMKQLKIEKKKQEKEKAKENLKAAIEKHSSLLNRRLSLGQMKEIPQIRQLLEELSKK